MANLAEDLPNPQDNDFQVDLNWKSNPAAKSLLDTIVSILAEEYIETAKQNPNIFTK